MSEKSRSAYWDSWKGLAIIAVVIIHATGTAVKFPVDSGNFQFGLITRQFVNYAVPMFLALAGYFAANSVNEPAGQYYRKRLWRILAPYTIWTAIYLLIKSPLKIPGIDEILRAWLLGTGITIGYFVIVLSQFILLTPLILKIRSIKAHALLIAAMTILGNSFTYYFKTVDTESFFSGFPEGALPFFVWYPFYHLGILFGIYKNEIRVDRINTPALSAAIIFGIILAVAEGEFYSYQGNIGFGVSQLKISCLLVSSLLFVLAISLSAKGTWLDKPGILSWLGINSFGIYLTHLLFLWASRKMQIIDPLYDWQFFYVFLTALISIGGSSILIIFVRRILSSKKANLILG